MCPLWVYNKGTKREGKPKTRKAKKMTKISAKLAKKIEKAGVYYTANYRYAYRHGGFYRQPAWKAASGRGLVEWDAVDVSNGGTTK